MSRILAVATAACVALAIIVAPVSAADDTAIVSPPKIFAPKLEKVRTKSGLDVLLPSRVRVYVKASRVAGKAVATDGRYDLQLGVGRRCNGANVCFLASFGAVRGEQPSTEGTRVKLFGGRTGYFFPVSCGASCSPASIEWLEGDVLYSIATKGVTENRERSTLVKLANEAVKAGPR
jgi:hypothetical protein